MTSCASRRPNLNHRRAPLHGLRSGSFCGFWSRPMACRLVSLAPSRRSASGSWHPCQSTCLWKKWTRHWQLVARNRPSAGETMRSCSYLLVLRCGREKLPASVSQTSTGGKEKSKRSKPAGTGVSVNWIRRPFKTPVNRRARYRVRGRTVSRRRGESELCARRI